MARPAIQLTEKEQRLVAAVNEYREQRGLAPLTVDPILMQEARSAAPHFSHCINGKWCWHRCRARGFQGWATDDLANGHPTPEDAVQGWATSDGHARQMRGYFKMNGRWQNYQFDRIGVGISGLLSAGVAHEINNPLSYIANNLAVLDRDLSGVLDLIAAYESADATLGSAAPGCLARVEEIREEIDWEYVRENLGRMLARQGSFLRPIDAHDIMCAVGNAAVSGGVRRTAMISLFDATDDEMRLSNAIRFGGTKQAPADDFDPDADEDREED